MNSMQKLANECKKASLELAAITTEQKNAFLKILAQNIKKASQTILTANQLDITHAKAKGLDESMVDRLSLQSRLEGVVHDLLTVISLPDPVGESFDSFVSPNGLNISKRRTPIGVLGVIYESRPNVTLDITGLAIKSGNCAILRGGSETLNTNIELVRVIKASLEEASLPKAAIQLIESTDREQVLQLLHMHEHIDLIIPRGGANLHAFCRQNSTIPVITGGIGICHLFVDTTANQAKSLEVITNAKVQRPTVCNALDTLLVHQDIAKEFIPQVVQKLRALNVKFKLDPQAIAIMQNDLSECTPALEGDWDTEWLSLVLGIKVVKDLDAAILHIQEHSSGHSDGILSENTRNIERFLAIVDSAAVYANASTRFTDGSQLGLGAEVAISTQKLHARGPMGLKELTTYKWVIEGDYSVRK